MAFLLEMLGLIMKPLLLVTVSCQFGARSIYIVIQTWIELIRAAIYLHLVILWRLAMAGIALLTLPIRAFTALFRERMLEMQVQRMRRELENVFWDKKELQGRLRIAVRERKMIETMLRELENEHDEAIDKIELLDREIRDLKNEIRRLKEVQGKVLLDNKNGAKKASNIKNSDKFGTSLHMPDTTLVSEYVSKDQMPELTKDGSNIYGPALLLTTNMPSEVLLRDDIQAKHRAVARSRSLFSAILSLVVGIIVWEAKDPCMPLVVALFTVVTMSLVSVVQFYYTIEHKPASDAVALLSFNWFVLGMLAYPTLPKVARTLAPLAERTFEWLFL